MNSASQSTAATAITIRVAEFSRTPGARYDYEGPFSGEQFRDNVLLGKFREAVARGVKLIVDLDGTRGYPTSFLDEAFAGLVRKYRYSPEQVLSTLELKCENDPRWGEYSRSRIRIAKPD